MHKFLTIKGFQIHRSLTTLLTNLLRKGQIRCTEMCLNSIKSCPLKQTACVHTYLFDSLIDLIYTHMWCCAGHPALWVYRCHSALVCLQPF